MKEKEMYDRLVEIVKQDDFKEVGFSPANEHYSWMKEIRDLRTTQDSFLLTGLELLAMAYVSEEPDEGLIKFYHERIIELLEDEETNERVNKFFDEIDLTNE